MTPINLISPEIDCILRDRAAKLLPAPKLDADGFPEFYVQVKKFKGSELPEKFRTGKKINPKRSYTVQFQKMVMMDHYAEIKQLYILHGFSGVSEYERIINAFGDMLHDMGLGDNSAVNPLF